MSVQPPVRMHTAKFWVLVEGTMNYSGKIATLKAKGLTQNKPVVSLNQEAICIEIELPEDYFDDSQPQVKITVPKPEVDPVAQTVTAVVKPRTKSKAAAVIHR